MRSGCAPVYASAGWGGARGLPPLRFVGLCRSGRGVGVAVLESELAYTGVPALRAGQCSPTPFDIARANFMLPGTLVWLDRVPSALTLVEAGARGSLVGEPHRRLELVAVAVDVD